MTATRRRLLLTGAVAAALALAALAWWLTRPPPAGDGGEGPVAGQPWFLDIAAAAKLDFRHFDPATPTHYIHETIGSGLGWIDYDNDGWPDLFCVQAGPVRPAKGDPRPTCKLYRNNRDGTFLDVTARAGLGRAGFGQGVAVGDFDNDGFDDLALTYVGGVALYRNQGDGTFADVTARARLHNPHWATSCGWGDIDNDGFLDLYVCNYVEADLANYPVCQTGTPPRRYVCPPTTFAHATHKLFRNNGDGTFTDISVPSGIASAPAAPGLGVVLIDLDGDGLLDIYVANDLKPQYLFHNQGGGRFVERGLLAGCGLGPGGRPVSGMGVEAADLDGSGRPSLFVTNFHNEPNLLFLNRGRLHFEEATDRSGLAFPSLDRLGFGTALLDADRDGRLDLAVANGHIHREAQQLYGAPYAQRPQLFLGDGAGRYRDVSDGAGPYFRAAHVGRGLAWADFDNDGKPDLAVSHCGGPVALLHNRTETGHNWLGLQLVGDGKKSNRNAIGARVEVVTAGGRQVRFVQGGGSYLSAGERRVLIGLGASGSAERVTVRWPSGREQQWREVAGGRWWRVTEGRVEMQR